MTNIDSRDLVFVNVSTGYYLIIQDNNVIGDVKRRYKQQEIWTKWPRANLVRNTIADIAKTHKFVNYSGYGHVTYY